MQAKDHHSSRLKLGRVEGEGQWRKKKARTNEEPRNREWTSVKFESNQTKKNKKQKKNKKHHQHQQLSNISFIVLISRHCATENVVSAATNHTVRLLIPAVGHTPPLTPYICINIYSLQMTFVGLFAGGMRGVRRVSVHKLVQSGQRKRFCKERDEWAGPIPMEHMLRQRSRMQVFFYFVQEC